MHQVKDADRVQTLGSLTIPLSRLMSNANLSLDQWFQLDNSGSASRIYINTVLRVNDQSCTALHKEIKKVNTQKHKVEVCTGVTTGNEFCDFDCDFISYFFHCTIGPVVR